jgi:uncharacterized protein YcbK (DUF882 family)
MGDLTKDFNRQEFACPHCGRIVGPQEPLVAMLQRARTAKGRALHVVDGYRCPAYNRQVGGVLHSEHLRGNAADVFGGYATADEWVSYGAVGIGLRDGVVIHVDMRAGRPTRFTD